MDGSYCSFYRHLVGVYVCVSDRRAEIEAIHFKNLNYNLSILLKKKEARETDKMTGGKDDLACVSLCWRCAKRLHVPLYRTQPQAHKQQQACIGADKSENKLWPCECSVIWFVNRSII